MYKLRDWINPGLITQRLSFNVRAVEYLEKHEHLIINDAILLNENAIHIIEKRINAGVHTNVNMNKNAINFLRNNRHYMNYNILCGHEHGIEFVDELIKNNELNKINWMTLSKNPAAMHILNNINIHMIGWYNIIFNKNACELIKNNLHMVEKYWNTISKQPHLIEIIECNMDKVSWDELSENYNAIHILENNIRKINIDKLHNNKNGFKLLLLLNHEFNDYVYYHENIVYEYFDYCEQNNIPFNLIRCLSEYGYTEKHMEFLKHNHYYSCLSMNPNIFEYDYKRMRETRQSLLWYNDIKK